MTLKKREFTPESGTVDTYVPTPRPETMTATAYLRAIEQDHFVDLSVSINCTLRHQTFSNAYLVSLKKRKKNTTKIIESQKL